MKGSPILRLIIILMILAAVFWPVFRVTHHTAENVPKMPLTDTQAPISSSLRATILLHTAPPPLHCSVTVRGKILLTEKDLIAPGEYRASVEISKGDDLVITADWKDDDPHALRAEVLIHGYQVPLEKNFWAQHSLEDTFSIPESFLHYDDRATATH